MTWIVIGSVVGYFLVGILCSRPLFEYLERTAGRKSVKLSTFGAGMCCVFWPLLLAIAIIDALLFTLGWLSGGRG